MTVAFVNHGAKKSLAIQGNGLFASGIGTFLTFVGGLETAKSRDRKSHSRLKYKQLASIYYVTFAVTMNTLTAAVILSLDQSLHFHTDKSFVEVVVKVFENRFEKPGLTSYSLLKDVTCLGTTWH